MFAARTIDRFVEGEDAYDEVNEDDDQRKDGIELTVLELNAANDEQKENSYCKRAQKWNE